MWVGAWREGKQGENENFIESRQPPREVTEQVISKFWGGGEPYKRVAFLAVEKDI